MIDVSVLYIMILVQLTLTLIQGHRSARKKNCANYLTKFLINLDGILFSVETCRCYEPHTYFVLFFR